MNIICDTNVWYEIGAGIRNIEKLKARHRLIATPVNFLELASPTTTDLRISNRKIISMANQKHVYKTIRVSVNCESSAKVAEVFL